MAKLIKSFIFYEKQLKPAKVNLSQLKCLNNPTGPAARHHRPPIQYFFYSPLRTWVFHQKCEKKTIFLIKLEMLKIARVEKMWKNVSCPDLWHLLQRDAIKCKCSIMPDTINLRILLSEKSSWVLYYLMGKCAELTTFWELIFWKWLTDSYIVTSF